MTTNHCAPYDSLLTSSFRKSQVAIEYAYRFKDISPDAHVFWVYGGTIARFYQSYRRIAQKLELPSWDDPDVSILELVKQWLIETKEQYLLIIDNADNITNYWPGKYKSASTLDEPETNLALYLPDDHSAGKVMITTRDSRIAGRLAKYGKPITLQPMNVDEATKLFLARVENDYSREKGVLSKLVQTLDFLPLAVTQAASFIDENGITIAEYTAALEGDDEDAEEFLHEEVDDARRDEESVNSVIRTWKLTFDQISKQKPRAAELLSLLAMLDQQSVPRWLIKTPEMVTSIGLLSAFHMITLRSGSQSFQLHRLVQRFVSLSLKRAGTLQKWRDAALKCVSQAYPTEIGVEEWPTCDALAPHVQILIGYEFTSIEARLDLAHLLCWAADFDIERGMYVQALNRSKQSLDIFRALTAPNDERLAAATWLYGRLLHYESKSEADMEAAAEVLRQSLAISTHGTLNYAESAFELAHIYFAQGKEKECLEMGKASFECWQAMEGHRSVRTLDNMHDYALELAMFKHEEEAIAKWQDILDLCPSSDASDNTKTVYTYRSLASIAEFQGDAQLAEMLYSKLIDLCSTLYNPEHCHVFDYRLSHAEQILRQDRLEETMELTKVILETCKNKSEWRIKLSCHETMAECCKKNADLEGEEYHRLECVGLHSKYLGSNHKETISFADAAMRCLLSKADHQKAEPMAQQVLAWREANLGRDHPDTLNALEYLGICCTQQGQHTEAELHFTEALDRQEKTDPRVLDNVCSALWNQHKWEALEQRCRQALGIESEYRLGAHWMLITALEKQGKMAEALILRAESLQIEDRSHDTTSLKRRPGAPVEEPVLNRRFGRIIHPRTWSA